MKQTAVEWFAEELNNWRIREFGENAIIGIPSEVFDQAKEMEKEQIEKAFEEGMFHHTNGLCPNEYYKETFKSE